jgi:hypothetical protein
MKGKESRLKPCVHVLSARPAIPRLSYLSLLHSPPVAWQWQYARENRLGAKRTCPSTCLVMRISDSELSWWLPSSLPALHHPLHSHSPPWLSTVPQWQYLHPTVSEREGSRRSKSVQGHANRQTWQSPSRTRHTQLSRTKEGNGHTSSVALTSAPLAINRVAVATHPLKQAENSGVIMYYKAGVQ